MKRTGGDICTLYGIGFTPEELTAKRMSWNYIQHEQTARELEKDFGLDRVQGVSCGQ